MNLAFTRSFAKDLRQIRDTSVSDRLQEIICASRLPQAFKT